MATLDSSDHTSLVGFLLTGQSLLMATFTLVETLALGLWLTLVADAALFSVSMATGLAVLSVGLLIEHVLTDATVNGFSLSLPIERIVAVSLSEALLWVVWFDIAQRVGGVTGILLAGVVFAVLLVPQHTIEDNVLRGVEPLASVADLDTVGFSLVEAVGATLWLLFVLEGERFGGLLTAAGLGSVDPSAVGLALLAVVLFIEHDIAVALARRG